MAIFRLDLESETLAEPLRHDFGRRRNDVGLVGRSVFLFWSDPTARAAKGKKRWREHQWRLNWRLLAGVEFFQFQQAMAKYLTNRLKELTLSIRKAQNQSPALVRTLLKATFYNENLDQLASNLSARGGAWEFYGPEVKIHGILTVKHGMEKRFQDLAAARESFLAKVDSWEPGLKRLFGLVKSLGG
jgi:hypothetical protein